MIVIRRTLRHPFHFDNNEITKKQQLSGYGMGTSELLLRARHCGETGHFARKMQHFIVAKKIIDRAR